MAMAGEIGDIVKCPICLEQYEDPRKLPVCSHTFCKTCVISYVSKLDENAELSENGFPCPFCRTLNPGPKSRDVISTDLEWVNSLEQIKDFAVKTDNTETEQRMKNACDSCIVFGILTKATKICLDCFQLFCVHCSVGRHSGKLYEHHKVKELDEESEGRVKRLRELSDYSRCREHSDIDLNFFCSGDKTACCATCAVVYHRQCDSVVEIDNSHSEEVAKTEIESMKSSVDKLTAFAIEAVEIKKTALSKTKQQIDNIKDTLQDVRRKINQTLDLLEQTVIEQTNATMKKQIIKDDDETSALKQHIADLKNYSTLVETAIECASTTIFHGICQNLNEQIRFLEICILDICETSTYATVELELKVPLQSLLDTESFEAEKIVTITETEPRIQLPAYEGNALLRNHTAVKVYEKSLKENYKAKGSPTFSDIVFVSNEFLFLVDSYNGFCCLANADQEIISSCDLKVKNDVEYQTVPHYCTRLSGSKVAVSVPGQRKIFVLKASSTLSIEYEMTTDYTPQAIYGLKNGDIAVALKGPVAFGIISNDKIPKEKTYFCTDKAGRELKSFEYLAVDEGRKQVIQPCITDKAVYCFDFEGYPKFKYTNANLKETKGVALDNDGNIYVCSNRDKAIHVISPTGKSIRTVKEGIPSWPLAISFKMNGVEFAVTCDTTDYRRATFFKLQPP